MPSSHLRLGEVELEGVHQLVTEHVVGGSVRVGERHDDPVLQGFGHTAGALGDEPVQRIGLLEVRVVRVEDEGLLDVEVVLEEPRVALVPALGQASGVLNGLFRDRVVVDAEVRRLEDVEAQMVVLDLVASEVLGREGLARAERGERDQHRREPSQVRPHPRSLSDRIPGGSRPNEVLNQAR
jgi:hypothetical protein